MAIGSVVKLTDQGYVAEYFDMNSQTFEVRILEERGPFESRAEAEQAVQVMRRERDLD